MDLVSAAWIDWLTVILFGALLILELAFMSETLYPRNLMLSRMPMTVSDAVTTDIEKMSRKRSNAMDVDLKRTKNLPFLNFKPVPGMRHPKAWDSVIRFILTFKFPVVVFAVLIYCFAWYWWILSIITMIPAAYVQYSPQIQGLLFIGLLLGTLSSEIFCSGRLSDWLVLRLTRRNNNVRVAEMRLWLAYPAALLSASRLLLFLCPQCRADTWQWASSSGVSASIRTTIGWLAKWHSFYVSSLDILHSRTAKLSSRQSLPVSRWATPS